jgi:hypothetical protein
VAQDENLSFYLRKGSCCVTMFRFSGSGVDYGVDSWNPIDFQLGRERLLLEFVSRYYFKLLLLALPLRIFPANIPTRRLRACEPCCLDQLAHPKTIGNKGNQKEQTGIKLLFFFIFIVFFDKILGTVSLEMIPGWVCL